MDKTKSKTAYLLYTFFIVVFFGLAYAKLGLWVIPDYDAIMYVQKTLQIQMYFENGNFTALPPLPKANTLDVYIVSIFNYVVPLSYSVFILHTLYLLFFVYVVKVVKDELFAWILLTLIIANMHFLHMYGNFLTELKVGLLIVLATLLTFVKNRNMHVNVLLIIVNILLIFSRTIDIVIIIGLLGIYFILSYFSLDYAKNRLEVFKMYFISLLLTMPLLLITMPREIKYRISNWTGSLAQNWKDMSGIDNKYDLIYTIYQYILNYNKFVFVVLILSVIYFIFMKVVKKDKFFVFELIATAMVSIFIFILLAMANSTHIYLVFWPYIMFLLFITFFIYHSIKKLHINIQHSVKLLMFIVSAIALFYSFVLINEKETKKADIYTFSNQIANEIKTLAPNQRLIMFKNYAGLGPLDLLGMSVQNKIRYKVPSYRNKDKTYDENSRTPRNTILSYTTSISPYIQGMKNSNVMLIANTNFLWKNKAYIGINKYVEEISEYADVNYQELGYIKGKKILFNNDPTRYMQIYIKPKIYFSDIYSDLWIEKKTENIGILPNTSKLSNYSLEVEIHVPGRKTLLPLNIVLSDQDKYKTNVKVEKSGKQSIFFNLDNNIVWPMQIDVNNTFSSSNGDKRKLSIRILKSNLSKKQE